MKKETRILIRHRLERARESLEEAGILLERDYVNTFVNRLYYACFYAVSHYCLQEDFPQPNIAAFVASFIRTS